MNRRSLLGTLGGVALGWLGATALTNAGSSRFGDDDRNPADDAITDPPATTADAAPAATTGTPAAGSTASPASDPATADPSTPAARTSTESTSARTPAPTATGTPAAERRRIDTEARGHSSSPDESYTVLYTVSNEHPFPVRVRFGATVRLRDGSELRRERTVDLDADGVANDSFEFAGYDSTATGWSFGLVSVERTA